MQPSPESQTVDVKVVFQKASSSADTGLGRPLGGDKDPWADQERNGVKLNTHRQTGKSLATPTLSPIDFM